MGLRPHKLPKLAINYFRRGIEPDSGIRGKRMNITEHEMRGLLTGKCLPGDMRVNEELPAYLVRKFAELKAQRDALASENAALNSFIAKSCYVQTDTPSGWGSAIDYSPETAETNRLSVEESQFLTDVITAAVLLSNDKRYKALARRIAYFCVEKKLNSKAAQLRAGKPS